MRCPRHPAPRSWGSGERMPLQACPLSPRSNSWIGRSASRAVAFETQGISSKRHLPKLASRWAEGCGPLPVGAAKNRLQQLFGNWTVWWRKS